MSPKENGEVQDVKAERLKTYEEGVNEERVRIMTVLMKERDAATSDYAHTIKRTGGLLSKSMAFAYSKGFSDAIKTLNTKGLKK